jgi:hypothetical protein
MGVILDFSNWKRLNEQASQNPVKLNNEISALRDGDAAGMWALVKQYGGLTNVLDILADSGAERYALGSKIKAKFGKQHFDLGGDNKFPNVAKLLDAFDDETTWEKVKNLIPNDDTYAGGDVKDPEFFKKSSWKAPSGAGGGYAGGDTKDPEFKF